MGIEETIHIDNKVLFLVIRRDELRLVYKGQYMDSDESYLPLKKERLIYFILPIPVLLASIGALKGINQLFAISFAIVGILYLDILRTVKNIKKKNKSIL